MPNIYFMIFQDRKGTRERAIAKTDDSNTLRQTVQEFTAAVTYIHVVW